MPKAFYILIVRDNPMRIGGEQHDFEKVRVTGEPHKIGNFNFFSFAHPKSKQISIHEATTGGLVHKSETSSLKTALGEAKVLLDATPDFGLQLASVKDALQIAKEIPLEDYLNHEKQ